MMQDQLFDNLIEAGKSARRSGLLPQAIQLFTQALSKARSGDDHNSVCQALTLLGLCKKFVEDYDGALPILLEAARMDTEDVDIFWCASSLFSVLEIAQSTKPLRVTCRLLAEAESRILRWQMQQSRHNLEFVRALIAGDRGQFEKAQVHILEALRLKKMDQSGSGATDLSLLYEYAIACFKVNDKNGVSSALEQAVSAKYVTEYDYNRRVGIELLRIRSQNATEQLGSASVELARDMVMGKIFPSLCQIAARTLARGAQPSEGKVALLKAKRENMPPLSVFEHYLCLGDVLLTEVRSYLGLQLIDDEIITDAAYGDARASRREPASLSLAASLLREADSTYARIEDIAATEDERLETNFRTSVLKERRKRVLHIKEMM